MWCLGTCDGLVVNLGVFSLWLDSMILKDFSNFNDLWFYEKWMPHQQILGERSIIASLNLLDTFANAGQNFISSHCLRGALMSDAHLVDWDWQDFSCKAALQSVPRLILHQIQNYIPLFMELHVASASPLLQAAKFSPSGSSAIPCCLDKGEGIYIVWLW